MSSKYIREREELAKTSAQPYRDEDPESSAVLKVAAALSAILFSIAMVLYYQASQAENLAQLAKIKSSFSLAQLRLQQLATVRENYVVCMSNEASCGVKLAVFEEAVRQYPGVEPVMLSFDQPTFQLRGFL